VKAGIGDPSRLQRDLEQPGKRGLACSAEEFELRCRSRLTEAWPLNHAQQFPRKSLVLPWSR
jgi:hypothetical protein